MDNVLYEFYVSHKNKTVRISSHKDLGARRTEDEALTTQVEGTDDMESVQSLILALRPDFKIIEDFAHE